jgi:hypothetical protein
LKAEDHHWDELEEQDSLVKVGDPVVEVVTQAVPTDAPTSEPDPVKKSQ